MSEHAVTNPVSEETEKLEALQVTEREIVSGQHLIFYISKVYFF